MRCDVAIVGGGLTGLIAATVLMDRGIDCVLLDARQIGWGASGRNGGSATPRYKPGFAKLARDLGDETARLLHRRLHEGLDDIEANVGRFAIACDFRRCGQVTAAHSAAALKELEADVAWARSVGDRTPSLIDAQQTRERLGLTLYRGGYLDMRGASLHPLNYVRGLAAALHTAGVLLHEDTNVRRIRQEGPEVLVETLGGVYVRARAAILGTDAYLTGDITEERLRARFLTVASAIVTTAPLPEPLRQTIVPAGHVVADTFTLLNYFQVLPDGRLMFGGRGDVTGREDSPRIYQLLETRLCRLFPQLAEIPVTHRWSGLVGLTGSSLPQVAPLGPSIFTALGYAGRGVVPAHLLGRALADYVLGQTGRFGPLVAPLPPPIRFHRLKRAGMKAAVFYLGLRDRWEAAR